MSLCVIDIFERGVFFLKGVTTKNKKLQKRKKMSRDAKKKQMKLWSFCIIPMLLVFVLSYIPMYGIVIAFKDFKYDKGIFGSPWVGLNNFKFFFESNEFVRIVWNTLYMNFLFIVIGMSAAIILAILLYELTSARKVKIFHTILITPHFLSWVVVSYMLYSFISPTNGLFVKALEHLGMGKIDFYSMPKAWPVIFVIVDVWKRVGMDSILYYSSMMGIDESLYEVAYLEGANKWQKARYVTIPMLMPMIVLLAIMKIGAIFRADFGLFYQLPRNIGTLYITTDVVDTYIFRNLRELGNIGMSSAVGVLQSVVGFILILITNAVSKKIDPDYGLF